MDEITPLVLTYNEAPNIGRCLERLIWAKRVIVLDSLSSDDTTDLVRGFTNAELHERAFDNHTAQWNCGVDLVRTKWVLSLDADYVLTEEFIAELRALKVDDDVDAIYVPFRYCIFGKPLRACLYPPRAVLFRKDRCRYVPDGHTQLLEVPGKSLHLREFIDHDDRKTFSRWLISQDRYAILEVEKLLSANPHDLSLQDRLRLHIILAPMATLFYVLAVRGLIFDGWHGWYYCLQRLLAEIILSLRLIEARLSKFQDKKASSQSE